jgi:transcriptional regulator with XRE-family HTH domain
VRLKEVRKAKGFTRVALAEASGVSQVTLWRIETGRRSGQLDMWRKLAEVLGTSVADLIDDEEVA